MDWSVDQWVEWADRESRWLDEICNRFPDDEDAAESFDLNTYLSETECERFKKIADAPSDVFGGIAMGNNHSRSVSNLRMIAKEIPLDIAAGEGADRA